MLIPGLDEAKSMAEDFKVIPVSRTIMSDIKTPAEVLKILKNTSSHCYILESVENREKWGRYTFLGYDPKSEISCTNGVIREKDVRTGKVCEYKGDVRSRINGILAEHTSPKICGLPSFTGGLVGYFSYDYIKYSEPVLNLDAEDKEGFKDVDLMLFDKVIAFDNLKQLIYLIINITTQNLEQSYKNAEKEPDAMERLITRGEVCEYRRAKILSDFRPLFDKDSFCAMVEKVKKHIYDGDIFQAVLSNRLEADFEGSLLDAYRVLRTTNPSPYMFYFSSSDMEVAGASPETLVKLEDGVLHTFPLAGTRPRGKTDAEDKRLEAELLSDEKELAEHNMLVGLGRNDLGKISAFGSITVERYMSIERYSHVMHIGSTVRGLLADGRSPLDAVDAVLPAGTLSGAPKIRACKIINELENNKRGIYGGAIGYIDFTGNLDMCIAIRLAFRKNGKVFVRSGAGIVADSVPENEFTECINKAQAVVDALRAAQEVRV